MLFFLACLYVALYYIRPFEWVPVLMGKPVFFILSLISLAALLLAWGNGRIKLFTYKTDIMVLGFTLAIVMSHLRHGYIIGAIEGVREFFPVIIGYFLIAYALDTRVKIQWFVLLLICLTSFLAYESYLQVTTGAAHGGMEALLERNGYDEVGAYIFVTRTRWYGVFNDPNDLGLALVLVIPLLLERLYQRRWILSLLALPLVLYAVYCTNSRGAMLALGAGVVAFLVLRHRSVRGIIIGGLLACLGILFEPSRMASLSGSGESAYGRIYAWYEGFQMFKSCPFFGVGSGMFTEYHSLTAHNSYILVIAELGFFGAIFFTGLFVLPLVWAKVNLLMISTEAPMENQERGMACAVVGGLLGVMVAMFFLSRSYILLPYMMVAILAAISGQNSNTLNPDKDNVFERDINWLQLFLVVIFEIIFINIFVKVFI